MRSPNAPFESFLGPDIRAFLTYKRALGCRFDVEEKTLHLLDRYLTEQRVGSLLELTPQIVDAFLASRPRVRPRSYNHLLCTVRRLFDWLVFQGRCASSPVRARPRRRLVERRPFIFDPGSASRLLATAAGLADNSKAPLRGLTYRTIFALLYGLGLRVGEAARLLVRDVDFDRQLLLIRESKFYKSRLVPFGPRIGQMLTDYLQVKAGKGADASLAAPLFAFGRKRPIHPGTISQTFHALVPHLGLQVPPGSAAPRLHDLRHSFAVGTLLRWYRSGLDPSARLLHLSTFLGHVDVTSTAVYLTITEDLLLQANNRFEAQARALFQGEVSTCQSTSVR